MSSARQAATSPGRLILAAKTALAVGIAWAVAPYVPGVANEYPYYAPLGALAAAAPAAAADDRAARCGGACARRLCARRIVAARHGQRFAADRAGDLGRAGGIAGIGRSPRRRGARLRALHAREPAGLSRAAGRGLRRVAERARGRRRRGAARRRGRAPGRACRCGQGRQVLLLRRRCRESHADIALFGNRLSHRGGNEGGGRRARRLGEGFPEWRSAGLPVTVGPAAGTLM